MAAGDSIISRGASFVPAASVEILLLWAYTDNAAIFIGNQNAAGDLIRNINPNPNVTSTAAFAPILKFAITNEWFFYSNITIDRGFSGIQLK